jgi:hypothetical protein
MRIPRFSTTAGATVRALILAMAAMSLGAVAASAQADEMAGGAGASAGPHASSPMAPRFGPGIVPPFGSSAMPPSGSRMVPPFGSSPVPPLGPGIVPPLGPTIVPPLVSAPCCQGGADHGRRHRFPFLAFGVPTTTSPSAVGADQTAQPAPGADLPPPPSDFEPRLVTLKPLAARPGDPATVIVMRAGESQEVVKFAETETR